MMVKMMEGVLSELILILKVEAQERIQAKLFTFINQTHIVQLS